VVTKAIEEVEELSAMLKKVKETVRWFKQSVVASDALRKAQKKANQENLLALSKTYQHVGIRRITCLNDS
jgi:hypothetical protein